MIVNKLLRSFFRRHILRSESWIKVNRNFDLVRWHIQEKLVQERHHSCLRSLVSFILFQLFNVLKFMLNYLFITELNKVLLFLQVWQMSHFLLSLIYCKLNFHSKSHLFTLHTSLFCFRNHQITLIRSMWHALRIFGRLRVYTAEKWSYNTLLTQSHCFCS